jgi:hypothetical protein
MNDLCKSRHGRDLVDFFILLQAASHCLVMVQASLSRVWQAKSTKNFPCPCEGAFTLRKIQENIRRHCAYSSSPLSSSSAAASPAAAFLAGFFFFFLFFLVEAFPMGCSRILRISSSSIFLSDLTFSRSRAGG